MNFDYGLIHFENILSSDHEMYSLILLDTRNITFMMNGIRCYLSGKYILCLSNDDVIKGVSGAYVAHTFRYLPYFINVNLSHEIIGNPLYESMRAEHRYPDFHLFRKRDNDFFGIISLTESEYETAKLYFDRAARYIEAYDTDLMWSCRTRSDLFSILNIAESAFCGTNVKEENDIIRWIKDNAGAKKLSLNTLCEQFHMSRTTVANTVHALTGMSPMVYVLEERLTQVLPDLLFTQVPIGMLSERYGFSDVNYFIRAFKKKYGKPPLQYRKDGYDERLKNEKLYQKKELDVMFLDYLKKGLGRAITLLQGQPDKTPYRQTLIDFITTNKLTGRSLGEYEKQLIDCFDDKAAMSKEIAESLLAQIAAGENTKSIPLLMLLGYGDTARE